MLHNPQSPFKIRANYSVSTTVLWVTNKLGGYYLGSYLLAGLEEGSKRALILTKNYANMPCTRESKTSRRFHVEPCVEIHDRFVWIMGLCLASLFWCLIGVQHCPTMSNCFSSDDGGCMTSRCKSQHWSGKLRLSVAEVAAGVVAFCGHFMWVWINTY